MIQKPRPSDIAYLRVAMRRAAEVVAKAAATPSCPEVVDLANRVQVALDMVRQMTITSDGATFAICAVEGAADYLDWYITDPAWRGDPQALIQAAWLCGKAEAFASLQSSANRGRTGRPKGAPGADRILAAVKAAPNGSHKAIADAAYVTEEYVRKVRPRR